MRWANYRSPTDGQTHVGIVDSGRISGLEAGTSIEHLLAHDTFRSAADQAVHQPHEVLDLASVQLLSPVPVPPSIRDFMSFEDHVVTSLQAVGGVMSPVWYEQPTFYFSNPAAVIGPTDPVRMSPGSSAFDFELEIAAVIGREGSDVSVDDAEQYIAGYTLMCDWSARDLQERETKVGLGPAKGKDTATTLGPVLVSRDELEPLRSGQGYDVDLSVHVNGRPYSVGNWSSLYWSFAQMISYASRGTTIRPGDLIGSGTVGTGCILELGRVHGRIAYPYLSAGDVVRLDGGVLGELELVVAPGIEPQPLWPDHAHENRNLHV